MSEVDNEETTKMATGGFVSGAYTEGMKTNTAVDVRYFKHADGRVIYITYINDRPMTAIPKGFTQTDTPVEQKVGKEAEDAAAAARANAGAGAGGGGDQAQPIDARTAAFFDNETKEQRDDRMGKVNDFLQGVVNFAVPGMGIINALPGIISSPVVGAIANVFGSRQDPNLATVEDAVGKTVTAEDRYGFTAEQPGTPEMSPETQYGFTAEQPGTPAPESTPSASETQSISDQNTGGDGGGYGGYSDGGGSSSFGEGQYAKGGFVSKKTKSAIKAKKGLASR
jgi:hypothetical protein